MLNNSDTATYAKECSAVTKVERAVAKYISQAECEDDFLPVLEEDTRSALHYHLSPMRKALLSWYNFEKDARVLELGAGMGALTGLLCTNCGTVFAIEENAFYRQALHNRYSLVKNLAILPNMQSIGGTQFNYIVMVAPKQLNLSILRTIKNYLCQNGKLLLTIPNRFALSAFCGETAFTGALPFNEIDCETSQSAYGKKALENLLQTAGFRSDNCKWYYPTKDYIFPQEIYSNECLPPIEGNSRYYPAIGSNYSALLPYSSLLPQIIAEDMFPAFANSFLVECRVNSKTPPCPTNYAAVTEGRLPEGRLATTVEEHKVYKKALHPKSVARLEQIKHNNNCLQAQGIGVVPCKLTADTLEMPRMPSVTLWNEWNMQSRAGTFNENNFMLLLEQIICAIKKSSAADAPGSHGWPIELGPVQHTAFLELVPANCFYNKTKGELLFFDQEFTQDNCPLSIPIFRAVNNACACAGAAHLLEHIKEKYNLADIWSMLCDENVRVSERIFGVSRDKLINSGRTPVNIESNRQTLAVKGLASQLLAQKVYNIAIYGYAEIGKTLSTLLPVFGVSVAYIIDKKAESVTHESNILPICLPSETPNLNIDAVIVTLQKTGEVVAEKLRENYNCPVFTLRELAQT